MDASSATIDCRKPPSHAVVEFFERYSARLDGRWLAAMPLEGDIKEICDECTRSMRDIVVGPWIKR